MRVLVTDPIADAGLDLLRSAGHEVITAYETEGDELFEQIADVHGLIVRSGTTVSAELLDAAPALQIVGRAGIGIDNIDLTAATDHGVIVANAPKGNVRAAAEHTVGMTFATARSIPQAHGRLKAGDWAKDDYLGTELDGKSLGIVGLGSVGQEVARHLSGLGMTPIAYDPYISRERADQLGVDLVDFESCLDRAHFLTIHTPLTSETKGLIDEDALATFGGGYLINCARGGIVDEEALAEAVEEGPLDGAAIDVYESEPIEPDNPLMAVEDIVMTPHLGASTEAAQEKVAVSIAEQLLAAFEGEPVRNALNAPSIDESAVPQLRPYIDLAETAGRIAVQLVDDRVDAVEIIYEGDIADEQVDFITASALKGVFGPLEWQANTVNASAIAEDRGIDVTESKRQTDDFRSAVTVSVADTDQEVKVTGALVLDDDPRIVRIDGYRVDAVPYGHMLVTRNRDVPGVIGFIGTILGDHDINVAGMFNAREAIGGEALTVYNLDDPVPESVCEELLADERVTAATPIELPSP